MDFYKLLSTCNEDYTGWASAVAAFSAVVSWTNHLFIVIMADAQRNADLSLTIFRPLQTGFGFTTRISYLFFSPASTFWTTFYFLESRKFSHYYFLKSRIFSMYFYFPDNTEHQSQTMRKMVDQCINEWQCIGGVCTDELLCYVTFYS